MIYTPEHPMADKSGRVTEHRLVMSRVVGRSLNRDEWVHHKDGNRQNNEPSNLELCGKKQPPLQRLSDMVDDYALLKREDGVALLALRDAINSELERRLGVED
jgi:HNH endonuclease